MRLGHVIDHKALPFEQHMDAPVAVADVPVQRLSCADAEPHRRSDVVLYLIIMRQEPMALHARRSLIP